MNRMNYMYNPAASNTRADIKNILGRVKVHYNELGDIVKKLDALLGKNCSTISEIETMLAEMDPPPSTKIKMDQDETQWNWKTVVRGKSTSSAVSPPGEYPAEAPQLKSTQAPQMQKIKIQNSFGVKAIPVNSFSDIRADGKLYYVVGNDHFGFILNDKLFHGNIGKIYTDEKSPEKIKNCKYAASCIKQNKCDYYHDPLCFKDSTDRKNFIASSWLYSPPNTQFKNHIRSRRFGSLEHLETDYSRLNEEEISRFYDQTTHDVLCSLLLNETQKKN